MKTKGALLCVLFWSLLLTEQTSAQLLGNAVDALNKSGSVIFTGSENNATKKKDVKQQKAFTGEDDVFITVYLKQKISALQLSKKDGQSRVAFKLSLASNPSQNFLYYAPISSAVLNQKYFCFQLDGEHLDYNNAEDKQFLSFLEKLSNDKHTINCCLNSRCDVVKSTFTLDFSNGKAKFGKAIEAMKEQKAQAKKEQEANAAKVAAAQEAKAAENQKIKEVYEKATDFLHITVENTSTFAQAKVKVETANSTTNQYLNVGAQKSLKVRCRPNEKLYAAGKLIATISASDKDKTYKVDVPAPQIKKLSTTWSDSWNQWDISTTNGSSKMKTAWSDSWNEWEFKTKKYGSFKLKTVWSDSWNKWEITHSKYGKITLKTTWSDSWNKWEIDDRMPDAPPYAKMVSIFCCVNAGAIFSQPKK
ncbi:MAG: hypothetical protein GY810_04775 [Aureispira sp.]|nr:hypothetical protein [Aureispira sp.]